MGRKRKFDSALEELLAIAPSTVLKDLILPLVTDRPDIRRECFEFLKTHTSLSNELEKKSEGEVMWALWSELEPDLSDSDKYGGGDYDTVDHVADLLYQIVKQLDSKKVDPDSRREILDLVFPYIESGNAGMDDMLYDIAYAACYDDADLHRLAKSFEAMKGDWKIEHARCIYKRLGCRDKYLELRKQKMVYGADYHDLATFYWEAGEKEKALQVADKGLRVGEGRMDELREFLASRAKESGNRERYLALQFEQTTDGLTFDKYKAFKKRCKKTEWATFEQKLLAQIKDGQRTEQLKIRMYRKEYEKAIAILTKGRYPTLGWDGGYEVKIAKKLEKRYPEEILKYYVSGLGNMKVNALRKEYARRAKVIVKVRYVLVEVLDDEKRWNVFAAKVKQYNIRRPAFQEEFAKIVPGWRELKENGSK